MFLTCFQKIEDFDIERIQRKLLTANFTAEKCSFRKTLMKTKLVMVTISNPGFT